MDFLDLSYFFKTKEQAIDFSAKLSSIAQKAFDTDFDLDTVLLQQLGLRKRDKFNTLMRENNVHVGMNLEVKKFIELIQNKISFLPVLSITLAFEPTEQTLQALSDWFILNKKQVLFDIAVDKNLVAGIALYFNGTYLDFSVKQQFEKILLETLQSDTVTHLAPPPTQPSSPLPSEEKAQPAPVPIQPAQQSQP